MSLPVVRVSIMRVQPERFDEFRDLMAESRASLAAGIQAMRGGRLYIAGADAATASLTNVSIWDSLADAQQMDGFQPMLDLGRRFADLGAQFEGPIMNYQGLWRLDGLQSAEAR